MRTGFPLRGAMTLAIITAFSPQTLLAQAAAIVVELHGKCFVRRASDSSSKPQLITKTGEKIFVEDLVRCGPGGKVTLDFGYARKVLGPSREEYAVPLAPSQPLTREQKLLSEAIRDYGTRGGRSRSVGRLLYSPPADGAVLSQSFVVRWASGAAEKVALRIETESNHELFRQDGIDGSAGQFTSHAMRAALRSPEAAGELRLSIYADGSTTASDQVEFRLLSSEEQRSLDVDLDHANDEQFPLMRHMVRAYAFSRRQLWAEAALEYEHAVAEAPNSNDVLERAIRAENETGNLSRQAQFEDQLRKLQRTPKKP